MLLLPPFTILPPPPFDIPLLTLLMTDTSLFILAELIFRLLYVCSMNIMSVDVFRLLAVLPISKLVGETTGLPSNADPLSVISSVLSVKLMWAELLLPTIIVSMESMDDFLTVGLGVVVAMTAADSAGLLAGGMLGGGGDVTGGSFGSCLPLDFPVGDD